MEAPVSDLSPRAQALVDSARDRDVMPARDKARIRRRVLARIAAATLATAAGTSTSRTAASLGTKAALGTMGAKLAVVGVAASLLVAGGAVRGVLSSHEPPQRSSVIASVQASPASPPPAPAPPLEAPAVSSIPPAAEPQKARPAELSAHAARGQATLEQELPLLQAAQEALRAGQPQRALALLDAHAKLYPHGALAEERRAAHAIATCRVAAGPAATAEADAFVRDAPGSPLVERVRAACGSPASAGTDRGR
jgi:RNA polymerase sigma-70 factor (ECF subfamily)